MFLSTCNYFLNFIYLILFLAASGLICGTWDLRCCMWDLSLWRTGFSLVVARGLCSLRHTGSLVEGTGLVAP